MSSEILKKAEESKFSTEGFTKKIKGLWIDPKIFTFSFNCRCGGECCNYGVYTDLKESEMILEIKDKVIPLMDETQTKMAEFWFEAPEKDDDFESGVAVGTNIINGKCTFLDKNGLCSLQKLAIIEGEYKWKYKPIYCVLFPLTVYENSLTIDDDHIDRLKTCNKEGLTEMSIYEACKEEIIHFFGAEAFSELEQYRVEYLESLKVKNAI
jgi:Fe-S-cluster containining protein